MSFLLWILGSLLSISLIGDYPYIALSITGLAGIAFGLNSFLDHRAGLVRNKRATPEILDDAKRKAIVRYGWLIDVAATLLLIFPTRWMAAGFFLVLVSWLLRWWTFKRIIPRTLFDLPILALMVMVPVSLWASADLTVSIVPLGQIVAGVNVFYAIAERVKTEADLRWVLAGFIALGTVIALLAPFSVDWIKTKFFDLPQVYSHFLELLPKGIHPNLLAGALALIFPIGVAVILFAPMLWLPTRKRVAGRILLAFGLAAMSVILILSQSRGGLAAAAFGLLILFSFRTRWALGVALVVAVGLGVFMLSRWNVSRLADIFFSTDTISGLAGREEVWSRAVYALQDVPYTGIGLGMFSRAVSVLYPLFLVGPDVDIGYAHNIYLQVGVDLGIPGLVAYLALLTLGLVAAWQAFRFARQQGSGDLAAVALGLGVSLGVIMLHGLVDSAVWDTKPAILSWALFGTIAAVDRRSVMAFLESRAGLTELEAIEGSSRQGAVQRERIWFEGGVARRHALDKILYASPAFDRVVESGFAFLEPSAGERILDLGCGEGKETASLARLGLHVIALDLSYAQLMHARRQLNGQVSDTQVSFVQANAEQLPFAPGSFRIIYGKAVLHHLDVPSVSAEVERVLRPDGRASFAEPLAHHPLFWLVRHLTPGLRTRDEYPFTVSKLGQIGQRFNRYEILFYFLLAPLVYPARLVPRGERLFRYLHAGLQRLDARLFSALPLLRGLSWYGLINVRREGNAFQNAPSKRIGE